ncbi:type II toxin-antitoxin system VapC family toxin [Billgrantia azerbaijanica]|nr:type II toxin-antitoxin system VapC family toxin [Halomonas azerbaijanica]
MDTNYILGLLKSSPRVLEDAARRNLKSLECGYSAITRMELLGFPGIPSEESKLISQRLGVLRYFPLTEQVEERTIALRQSRRIKLPDAIIAATALEHDLQLLTFDQKLAAIMSSIDN